MRELERSEGGRGRQRARGREGKNVEGEKKIAIKKDCEGEKRQIKSNRERKKKKIEIKNNKSAGVRGKQIKRMRLIKKQRMKV